MPKEAPAARLSRLSENSCGVFPRRSGEHGRRDREPMAAPLPPGVIERMLPHTYRMVAVSTSVRATIAGRPALGGDEAAAAGRSAGERYGLEGVHAVRPEIVVPTRTARRTDFAKVYFGERAIDDPGGRRAAHDRRRGHAAAARARARQRGVRDRVRGRPAAATDLRPRAAAYLERHARRGRPGVGALRGCSPSSIPMHPARSTLEVKTRRLLVAHGFDDFVREFPLDWKGRTYRYDFAFPTRRTILETNGRRWHDDADRLRARQREVERARPCAVPHRVRHLGQGRPPPEGADRRAAGGDELVRGPARRRARPSRRSGVGSRRGRGRSRRGRALARARGSRRWPSTTAACAISNSSVTGSPEPARTVRAPRRSGRPAWRGSRCRRTGRRCRVLRGTRAPVASPATTASR